MSIIMFSLADLQRVYCAPAGFIRPDVSEKYLLPSSVLSLVEPGERWSDIKYFCYTTSTGPAGTML